MPSSKKTDQPPIIELLATKDLLVEEGFNVRSPRDFKANTIELTALVEANGGKIDPSIHVVQYVEREGKKLIRGGHTLHAVATALGIKTIPAIKTEMDGVQELVNLVTSNAGHPLSPLEQGEVYKRLVAGGNAEDTPVGQEIRAPMIHAEIARAVGYTASHVQQCICVAESIPEIRELILDGSVSPNVVRDANRQIETDSKRLACINAAIKLAKSEDKETATLKHYEAVKAGYVKPKKLKAVSTSEQTPATPSDAPSGASMPEAQEKPAGGQSEEDSADSEAQPEPDQPDEAPVGQTNVGAVMPELDLSSPETEKPAPALKPKEVKKLDAAIRAEIAATSDRMDLGLDDTDIDAMADNIMGVISSHQSPI
jgi:hypothetical protein